MKTKPTGRDELRRIGDAIDESILNASSEVLRDELVSQGLDANEVVAEMDAITEKAKLAGAKMHLAQAKEAVKSFKARETDVSSTNRGVLRSRQLQMRSGKRTDDASMMMAARIGKKLSESDEEGALDDLAQLDSLEAQDPEGSGK